MKMLSQRHLILWTGMAFALGIVVGALVAKSHSYSAIVTAGNLLSTLSAVSIAAVFGFYLQSKAADRRSGKEIVLSNRRDVIRTMDDARKAAQIVSAKGADLSSLNSAIAKHSRAVKELEDDLKTFGMYDANTFNRADESLFKYRTYLADHVAEGKGEVRDEEESSRYQEHRDALRAVISSVASSQ